MSTQTNMSNHSNNMHMQLGFLEYLQMSKCTSIKLNISLYNVSLFCKMRGYTEKTTIGYMCKQDMQVTNDFDNSPSLLQIHKHKWSCPLKFN